jgi:hypothetical protein
MRYNCKGHDRRGIANGNSKASQQRYQLEKAPEPQASSGVIAMEVTIHSVTASVQTIDGGSLNGSTFGEIVAGIVQALDDQLRRDKQAARDLHSH